HLEKPPPNAWIRSDDRIVRRTGPFKRTRAHLDVASYMRACYTPRLRSGDRGVWMDGRPLLHTLLLAALAATATGCCGDAGGRGVRPVVFWHSMAGDLGKTMRVIVDKFNERHPETPIYPVYQGGYSMLNQKIRTSVVAGQPPVM